jgi:hypothetical protein
MLKCIDVSEVLVASIIKAISKPLLKNWINILNRLIKVYVVTLIMEVLSI